MNEKVVQVSCQLPFLKRPDYCKQYNVASDSLSVSCWDSVEVSWDCHSVAKVWRTVRTLEGETVVMMSSYGLGQRCSERHQLLGWITLHCTWQPHAKCSSSPNEMAVEYHIGSNVFVFIIRRFITRVVIAVFFYDWWIWVEQPPWLITQNTT